LRKSGCPYREIARLLGVNVHTAYSDVAAELCALRDETIDHAQELRSLELQRLDAMHMGLWPQIRAGNPPAVTAGIRVSERRSRLLGLDAPVASTTELTGRLSVETEAKYKAEREALLRLSAEELQELADASQQLMANALARADARRMAVTVAALPPAQSIIDVEAVKAEMPASPDAGEPATALGQAQDDPMTIVE
jgi:hypothetical protein